MFAGGGIGPFAGCSLAGVGSGQSYEQAAAWCALNIADDPVAALSAALGKIVAADALGIASKLPRKVGCIAHLILLRQEEGPPGGTTDPQLRAGLGSATYSAATAKGVSPSAPALSSIGALSATDRAPSSAADGTSPLASAS